LILIKGNLVSFWLKSSKKKKKYLIKLHERTGKINKLVTLKSYNINFLNLLMAAPV